MIKSILLTSLITLSSILIAQEIEVITQEKIQGVITIIAYSPDGSLIASGSAKENSVKVWDVNSGKIIGKLDGHEGATTAIGFSEDGTKLFSSSKDQYTIVWDIMNWKMIDSVNIGSPISAFINAPNDPNLLYASTLDGKILKWSLADFRKPIELYKEDLPIVKLDVNNTHLVSGGSGGKVTI